MPRTPAVDTTGGSIFFAYGKMILSDVIRARSFGGAGAVYGSGDVGG